MKCICWRQFSTDRSVELSCPCPSFIVVCIPRLQEMALEGVSSKIRNILLLHEKDRLMLDCKIFVYRMRYITDGKFPVIMSKPSIYFARQ